MKPAPIAERIISTNDVMDYTEPRHHEESASEVKLTGNSETSLQDAGMDYINLTDFEINDAVKLLKENNIDYEISGPKKNSVVTDQKITIDENNHRIKNIVLITGLTSKVVKDSPPVMPDLKGLSVRKSIKIVSSMGADFKVNGHGKVVETQPDAGSVLNKNQQIVINCAESKE